MKLRFLFRSLYVSKENKCFDKITTFPDGSSLYISAFIIARCSLKVFALFLEQHSVPLTDRCWLSMAYCGRGYLDVFWLGMFFLILSIFRLLLRIILSFVLFQQFIYLYWLMFALYWKRPLLVIFQGCIVYELDVISAFSRELVTLLGYLFCLVFTNVELSDR